VYRSSESFAFISVENSRYKAETILSNNSTGPQVLLEKELRNRSNIWTGRDDVFVHHTAILAEGFKSLSEDDKVTHEIIQGPKGLQAEKVAKTQ
jgi:cold shock CspA family protein